MESDYMNGVGLHNDIYSTNGIGLHEDLKLNGFYNGRMISHSKSFYRKTFPYNQVYFNANIFINMLLTLCTFAKKVRKTPCNSRKTCFS